MSFIQIRGHRIEYERVIAKQPAAVPPIVLLHEGLGSLAQWRDFPQLLADATGAEVIVYSRFGYGRSTPLGPGRHLRKPDYMHVEALESLPELIDAFGIERPVLVGHSDGASIALLQAGGLAPAKRVLSGVVVLAPHVFVEQEAIDGILKTREIYGTTPLRERLGKYHDDVDSTFWGWFDIWTDPAFRSWNIEAYLPRIDCPVLAIQGNEDEYGTLEQIERIVRQVAKVESVAIPQCGHSPHKDHPETVLVAIARFFEKLTLTTGCSMAASI